jgi:uncharacterized protein (DUF608 family)
MGAVSRAGRRYEGSYLARVAFPMGGMGAGTVCLEGSGALSHVSLHHRPDLKHEPLAFAAIALQGEKKFARVLEGPMPSWKLFPGSAYAGAASPYGGLPRFRNASFSLRFPFGQIELTDGGVPLKVQLLGWSPFEPGDEDSSSLPVAALEYTFFNASPRDVAAVFSFNAANFMRARPPKPDASGGCIRSLAGGFILRGSSDPDESANAGSFAAWVEDPAVKVNHAWSRALAPLATVWSEIEAGACYDRAPLLSGPPAPGASLFVPFLLPPGARQTIVLRLAWYVGQSTLRTAGGELYDFKRACAGDDTYRPWYAKRFADLHEVVTHWQGQYGALQAKSRRFADCFYDSTLPSEVIEAVAANLGVLKSTTVLRQEDGRLWGWEGSADHEGHCPGSCTHVWNYAQSIAHLFPALERGLRETEFGPNQNEEGWQAFRTALPIRAPDLRHAPAAADGQLGGIMKVYRDWRIGGDTGWLRKLWPKVRASLDFCIRTWDPRQQGWLDEPQHNTYDLWFWGANGMCTSIYLGALKAAVLMGGALQDEISCYAVLFERGVKKMEAELFDGEYFHQRIEWRSFDARFPDFYRDASSWFTPDLRARFAAPEVVELAEREGPPHQYGRGCLSDGVIGAWMAWASGIGDVIDTSKVESHLKSVCRYNFRRNLYGHSNPGRSSFAGAEESGLLVCTWPKGDAPSSPMLYCGEVWTGVEYQVASHLIALGMVEQGLRIVRAVRSRYDGRVRNPFDEIEAGHWYARSMSSYALLQALSGARYDAVDKVLHLRPTIAGDFRSFLSTAGGYGTVGVRNGKPFLEVVAGQIPCATIEFVPCGHG